MTHEETSALPSARWSRRLALFSFGLLLATFILHRFLSLSTLLAINLFAVGLAVATLAVLAGLVATVRIWVTGHRGAASAALGTLLGAAMIAGPAGYWLAHYHLPWINDVTTDITDPPAFVSLASRQRGANGTAYPGKAFAELQAKAYPDLRTLVLDRSAEEAFDLVEEAVRRLKWSLVAEEPPMTGKNAAPGLIEATEQTLVLGFTDDIVIRIEGGTTHAKIDARSASRYGSLDLGQNAARLRRLFAEIRARAELTPSAAATAAAKEKKDRKDKPGSALLKRKKAIDQRKARSRYGQGLGK